MAGQSRQSRSFTFTLTDANRQLLATPNVCDDRAPYQIRFYCARYAGRTDGLLVEFPSVCELKVNDTTIVGHVGYRGKMTSWEVCVIKTFNLEFEMFEG